MQTLRGQPSLTLRLKLTESSLTLVLLSLLPPPAVAAQPLQDDVNVGKDNEGGRQDGAVVEGHDQLISLELPHLVGDGLHFEECITVGERNVALI